MIPPQEDSDTGSMDKDSAGSSQQQQDSDATISETTDEEEAIETSMPIGDQDVSPLAVTISISLSASSADLDLEEGVNGKEKANEDDILDGDVEDTPTPCPPSLGVPCTTEAANQANPSLVQPSPVEDLEDPHKADYYDGKPSRQRPSRMRTFLMNLTGVLFVLAGIIGAVWHYRNEAQYETAETGQPVAAEVCTESDWNGCANLPEWKRPCTLAIEYNFTLVEEDSFDKTLFFSSRSGLALVEGNHIDKTLFISSYSGHDILSFARASEDCHGMVESSIQEYLNSTNFTIFYDPKDLDDSRYNEPHKASMSAAIIAAVLCGVGVMFFFTSVLECFL